MKSIKTYKTSKPLLNIIMCLLLYLAVINNISGQLNTYLNNMDSNNYNYFFIKERMYDYLDSLKATKDSISYYSGGGEYKEFKLFESIWEPQLIPHGDFSVYFDQEYDFFNNQLSNYNYVTQESWHELGPNVIQQTGDKGVGPVEFVTFFDNGTTQSTQYMLTGSALGGLFYSTDYGENWNKTGSEDWFTSGCGWAVFHPTDHNTWYASSSGGSTGGESIGKTGGIYRTNDEGQTWTQIADVNDLGGIWRIIYKLIIDPVNPGTLYAATNGGVFKTVNCGATDPTWTKVFTGFVYDLEMKPGNNNILYSSVFKDDFWKIWISQDGGNNWYAMSPQPAVLGSLDLRYQYLTIEVSKAKPDFLYAQTRNYYHFCFEHIENPV